MGPHYNPSLPIIKKGWEGNLVNNKGRFVNLDGPSHRGFKAVWDWKRTKNPYAKAKKNQKSNVKVIKNADFILDVQSGITWLGHATFLIRLGSYTLITDPVLGSIWPLKRYTALPCAVEDLENIDFILLSHNHRDHCDKSSLLKLTKVNPQAKILTGLGIKGLLEGWGINNPIQEAGWYQQYILPPALRVHYLPAKHWNRRFLHDLNTMLWGSFMIEMDGMTMYFGADSGIGRHYADIKKLFPQIDYGLFGIGAYEPVWFMKGSHTSPMDVIKIRHEMKIGKVIPMHYGTFDLSNEPVFHPKNVLKNLVKDQADWLFLDIGKKQLL